MDSEFPSSPAASAAGNSPNLGAAVAGLQRQCQELRATLFGLCVALLVLSAGFNILIVRQWRTATQQLEEQRNNFTRVVSEFRTQREPLIRNFVGALHLFATTNADVRPLLEKFRPALEAYYPPTLRPAVGPASAPPASEPSK